MKIAVLADIHSNLAALDAVLKSLGSVDVVWHLGDVVGYGPEPDGVVERLTEIGSIGIRGNHDDAACGGDTIWDFNPLARRAAEWTRSRITDRTRAYLDGLQEVLVPEGSDFTLVHGSPSHPIWEYLISIEAARRNMGSFSTPYCLVGHTHVPLVFRSDRGRIRAMPVENGSVLALDGRPSILNPGSVGQPRDGRPAASYLVVDTAAATATWHRVAYDIAATQDAMLAAGLPGPLARRLSFGQ
jgi:predicted phosphodiesterase